VLVILITAVFDCEMNKLKKYIQFVDSMNERIGKFIAWLTLLLVLVVCFDVVTRYVIKFSSVGVQELEWHLFAIIFLMGGAYTLKHEKHVRVDIIYSRLSKKKQAVINLIGVGLFLIPFCLLIINSSIDFVWNSFIIGESSPDPGGLPATASKVHIKSRAANFFCVYTNAGPFTYVQINIYPYRQIY